MQELKQLFSYKSCSWEQATKYSLSQKRASLWASTFFISFFLLPLHIKKFSWYPAILCTIFWPLTNKGITCHSLTSSASRESNSLLTILDQYNVIVEFALLRNIRETKSKIRMLIFREANFQIFRELVINETETYCGGIFSKNIKLLLGSPYFRNIVDSKGITTEVIPSVYRS